MAANEASVLQTLFSTLVECLNVETVKPYLVSNQMINLDECEELRVGMIRTAAHDTTSSCGEANNDLEAKT